MDTSRLDLFITAVEGYKPAIYVDIDFTLFLAPDRFNLSLITELRGIKEQYGDKIDIVAWSGGGRKYVEDIIENAGIADIVTICLAKPTIVIDDMGKDHMFLPIPKYIDPMTLEEYSDEETNS